MPTQPVRPDLPKRTSTPRPSKPSGIIPPTIADIRAYRTKFDKAAKKMSDQEIRKAIVKYKEERQKSFEGRQVQGGKSVGTSLDNFPSHYFNYLPDIPFNSQFLGNTSTVSRDTQDTSTTDHLDKTPTYMSTVPRNTQDADTTAHVDQTPTNMSTLTPNTQDDGSTASVDKAPTNMSTIPRNSQDASTTDHISRLPNELLDMIISKCIPDYDPRHNDRKDLQKEKISIYKDISKVCRRFKLVTEPHLYGSIEIVKAGNMGRSLLRTFCKRPHLATYVQRLTIEAYVGRGETYARRYDVPRIKDAIARLNLGRTGLQMASMICSFRCHNHEMMVILAMATNLKSLEFRLGVGLRKTSSLSTLDYEYHFSDLGRCLETIFAPKRLAWLRRIRKTTAYERLEAVRVCCTWGSDTPNPFSTTASAFHANLLGILQLPGLKHLECDGTVPLMDRNPGLVKSASKMSGLQSLQMKGGAFEFGTLTNVLNNCKSVAQVTVSWATRQLHEFEFSSQTSDSPEPALGLDLQRFSAALLSHRDNLRDLCLKDAYHSHNEISWSMLNLPSLGSLQRLRVLRKLEIDEVLLIGTREWFDMDSISNFDNILPPRLQELTVHTNASLEFDIGSILRNFATYTNKELGLLRITFAVSHFQIDEHRSNRVLKFLKNWSLDHAPWSLSRERDDTWKDSLPVFDRLCFSVDDRWGVRRPITSTFVEDAAEISQRGVVDMIDGVWLQ